MQGRLKRWGDRIEGRVDQGFAVGSRRVAEGDQLELRVGGGRWLPVTFEWSGTPDAIPRLRFDLGGTSRQAHFTVPPDAVFRWPIEAA